MKRIIVFRFHKDPIICKNRIRLLRKYNPDIQIFGLFGGLEKDWGKFQKILKPYLESIYFIQEKTSYQKYTHGDLAIKLWYEKIGKALSFDMLHLIEWDLLLLESLDKIYKHIPKNGVGLTSLTLVKNIEKKWSWLSKESQRNEWCNLLRFVKDRFNYNQEPYACEFAGACLPKKFLEEYSSIEIPGLCHDELRTPLFSQVFNLTLYDTCLCKKWFDESEKEFFNCDSKEINSSTITKELAKSSGRRAFHPFRKVLVFDIISYSANLSLIHSR